MKLFIDLALAARHPDYRMITVVATGVDNTGTDDELQRRLSEVSESIRQRPDLADLDNNPRIEAWRRAFEDFGADPAETKPSLEALLHRILAGQEIPFVSKAVAISNIVSLGHLLPSGGDDLTAIEGDFGLRYARGLEPFHAITDDEESHPEPGEVIYVDQQKVLCRRWIWRQGEATALTPQSTQIAVNVDVMPPATLEEGMAAAQEVAGLLRQHCGAETEILVIGGETQSVPLPHRTIAMITGERLKDDSIRRLLDERGSELSESGDMADWSIKDLFLRGNVERIVVEDELVPRLMKGERIKIYQGFDPTSTRLHVGHYVGFRTLRWFQVQGHHVIFLIGDATAMIGDPTGRSEERTMLTQEQVAVNMESYKEQAGMILEFGDEAANPVEVVRNSQWLFSMDLSQVLKLMSQITAQRLLERDMFQVRMKKGEPLGYVETIYPLLQGYDSVEMQVDAEVGGRDQLFNMLVGRDLCRSLLDRDKHVLTTPLLPGSDGRKMSKTYGNTIDLRATPFELYDGIMRVHDELILTYARLLTDLSWPELARLEGELAGDPMAVKERVALELATSFHGEEAALQAQREYVRVRREGSIPKDMDVARIPSSPEDGLLLDYLAAAEPAVAASKGELKRLIRQGGLTLGDDRVSDLGTRVAPGDLDGKVLRLGKKRFFRLTVARG